MFDIGPMELLILFVYPSSAILAAVYLSLALHNRSRRGQDTR